MTKSPIIQVCLTPALYPIYRNDKSIVVVVDIFRATSAICTALHHGIISVIPVAKVEDAKKYTGTEYIIAAERGGEVVQGFAFGNSPLSYRNNPEIIGKKLVLTTTNGTQAISAASEAAILCVGAFCNITSLASWLVSLQKDVMILCAGWKNRLNLEDTIFAGALTRLLLNHGFALDIDSDAALIALTLFEQSKKDINRFLEPSSHRQRLSKLNLHDDIEYCLQWDTSPVIPVLKNGELINIHEKMMNSSLKSLSNCKGD